MNFILFAELPETIEKLAWVAGGLLLVMLIFGALFYALSKFYQKVGPEEALVRAGGGKMIVEA